MIEAGKTLAHYEILEKIGAGGMGEVWKARDTTLNREVAIKVLPEIFSQDEERRGRFEREARLLAQLNHPGIAAVHGLHEDNGTHFLAMELVPGSDLYQRLQQGPLPVDEALKVGARVAEALEAAHEQGVIHRDLKPSNIVLMPGGAAKVLDFGLAKSVDTTSGDSDLSASPTITTPGTMEGVILGTAAYMSPEQARGKTVDKRTDIWAFGCVLYECLTGKTLFKGETVSDTIGAILHKDPDWGALPAGTPPAIVLLLKRCLTRDSEHRLRDIGDARIEIGQALQDPSGSYLGLAPAGTAGAEAAPSKRSHLTLGIVFGIVGVALGASLVTFFRSGAEPTALRKLDLGIDIEAPSLGDATAGISPDGSKIAFSHRGRLWVQFLDELGPRALEETEGGRAPFWSPDGTQIGFFRENRLWRVAADGGRPIGVAEIGQIASGGYGGCWSDDNRIIYARGNSGVSSVSGLGGEPKEILSVQAGDADFHEPTLLPDQKSIVFVLHPSGSPPGVLAAARNGERYELFRAVGPERFWRPVYSPHGYVLFGRSGGTANGIWALPFDASSLTATGEPFLVVPDASTPSLSRDGTLSFVIGATYQSGNEQLQWVDRAGKILGTEGSARDLADDLALSPDGRFLAFGTRDPESGNADIWIRDLERATETRVTNNEARYEFNFNWTPDGRHVYFSQFFSGIRAGDFRIQRVPADGSGTPVEICPGIIEDMVPDGSELVITRFDAPDSTLMNSDVPSFLVRVASDGSGDPEPILAGGATAIEGRLNPDGTLLAFQSEASGREEVFLTRYPEGIGRWQVSTEGGFDCQWGPLGDRIYYMEETKLMEVLVETEGGTLKLGRPVPLFDIPSHDFTLSRDGERFLIVGVPKRDDEDLAPRVGIKVVADWFKEFEGD